MNDAQPQQTYQVRFDWGTAGFQALAAEADVIVIADALPPTTEHGAHFSGRLSGRTDAESAVILPATLNNRTAVAEWVLARQAEKGARFSVVVIAAGERRADGALRFAVEDLFVAGAVIDALSTLGIDHCSPEAAAASASFVGLQRALRHLISASETGMALASQGRQSEIQRASQIDGSTEVAAAEEFHFLA
ncbi:2-phosphosulfolactate phosphatase [Glaciibacter psychrotolerans]|uniref:Probable 2-phosphosulfolactate phosphatase n=1 Tax=Glaciibacter psychrotolerans TaxID=670054 RepID=A0A7Z0J7H9_9MICO|nr:2-phosphosulfolactate phosphatase [Leifsonia psychrotolerans]